MKELKVILKAIKAFGLKIHPAFFILIPIVAVAIVKYLKARKAKAEAPADEDPSENARALAPRTPEALSALELRPDAFLKVWKNFLKEIPGSFRRSLEQFKPIVLLGGAGSGKSALVEQYTDWRRQSEQFFLGHAQDPNLQIYLGSRVVIQEVSPNLLNNNTKQARTALQKLWKKLFKRTTPSVIIVVSAKRLPAMTPDALERLAQRIRGKINILTWACGEPPNVRVALTHADAIEGYAEFSQFADSQGVPLFIRPKSSDMESMEKAFNLYESYLPLVLETRSANDYKKVIRFLRQGPTVFNPLSRFIDEIFCAESLSSQPNLESVYLTSKDFSSAVSNPFWIDPSTVQIDYNGPLRRHMAYASALTASLTITSLALYGHQRKEWFNAEDALESITLPHSANHDIDFQAISAFTRNDGRSVLEALQPEFLTDAQASVAKEASRGILMQHLLPGFVEAIRSKEPQLKSLYYLALIRSASSNDLGQFILNQLDHFSHATELRPELIKVYVENTDLPYEGSVSTAELPIQYQTMGVRDLEHWKFVLTQIRDLSTQDRAIDRAQLETLRELSSQLLEEQKQSERYRFAEALMNLLAKSPFEKDLQDYQSFLPQIEMTSLPDSARKPFRETLTLIAKSRFLPADSPPHTISELIQALKLAVQYPSVRAIEPQAWELEVLGDTFVFRNIDWFALMKKSRSEEVLKDFVQWHREHKASLFFKDPDAYLPVFLNPTNNGNALFVGKSHIDGIYTRDAFEAEVRPAIIELRDTLRELKLEPKLEAALQLLVDRKLTLYAQNYVGQISVFYNDFQLKADSSQSLLVILKQLLNPISPFTDFLKSVHRNTSLEFKPTEALAFGPMIHALAPFQSFNATMSISADNSSEYEKYRTIIDQLYTTMAQVSSEAGDGDAQTKLPGLQSVLSPAAKQALATLSGDSGTYIEMVENWLESVGLTQSLRRPFLEPVHQLHLVGLKELESVVNELWEFQIVPSFRPLLRQFPFDQKAKDEVNPATLTAHLHPSEGSYHQLKERYLAPVLSFNQGRYWAKASILRPLALPEDMLDTVTRLERLTRSLWDPTGTPKKLEFKVSPVPFSTRSVVGSHSMTLAYIGLGKESVVNINQKPFETKLSLDWTSKEVSQVGARITDTGTRLTVYPDPIMTRDSHWSYYHLLQRAERRGNIWSWELKLDGVSSKFEASFKLDQDPWTIFNIHPNAKSVAYEQPPVWQR